MRPTGMETLTERVETEARAEWARRIGIRLAHGDLFAPPMPASEFAAWPARANAGRGVLRRGRR